MSDVIRGSVARFVAIVVVILLMTEAWRHCLIAVVVAGKFVIRESCEQVGK